MRGDVADRSGTAGARRHLFRQILTKQLLLMVRYPVNTASRLLGLYFFFAVIFYGGQVAAGPAISETLDGLIVGFFLYTMVLAAYMGLAGNVMREAQWGTLEQLYLSPHGFGWVMGLKTLVNVLLSLLWGLAILGLMVATTGRTLTIAGPMLVHTVLPIGLLTIASAVGVGFLMAGLALIYKRIENLFQLFQFAFVGLIAAGGTGVTPLGVLPLAQGSGMLQLAMRKGYTILEFDPIDYALLVGSAVGYLAVGYYCFQLCQRRARRLGVMGEY